MARRAGGPRALDPGALFRSFAGQSGVLLAVSGGSDSTALLHLAARWRAEGGATPLFVATVDHCLRPASAAECDRVVGHAARLGLPAAVLRWEDASPGPALQERARKARHALLAAQARAVGADAVATAHTRDDQAETVLMRLVHGSAVAGLSGMRPRTMIGGMAFLKPLLAVDRAALAAMLEAEGIGWSEDPSNEDRRFERVRLRRLLDELAPLGLSPDRLARLAGRAARADAALEAATEALAQAARREGDTVLVERASLVAAPAEIRLRLLARLVCEAGGRSGARLRLERLEAVAASFDEVLARPAPLRRTLGGAILSLGSRYLRVSPEPARRKIAMAAGQDQS